MKCPRYDFHIHTKHLGCGNATMELNAIVEEGERLGVEVIGITDHFNVWEGGDGSSEFEKHELIRQDIKKLESNVEVYFGVEIDDGVLGRSPELTNRKIRDRAGFQFVVCACHFPFIEEYNLAKMVEAQHRHHLHICQDPLIDVLGHPYSFIKSQFDEKGWPWFNSMKPVPESYARELGQVSKETGTAIELNSTAALVNPKLTEDYVKEYIEYLSILADEGAIFSVGSDAHDISHLATIQEAWKVIEQLGISEDRIWCPKCKPMGGKKSY